MTFTIQDRLEILDLYARQSHAVDSGEAFAWAATFTPEGEFTSPTFRVKARGTAALTEFATMSHEAARRRSEQLRHCFSAIVLDAEGEGVRGTAYLMIVATGSTGSRIDRMLRVDDRLSDDPEHGWRFRSRVVHRDDVGLGG